MVSLGETFFETNRIQVKLLFFTCNPFIHRRNRKKVEGKTERLKINIQ
jgi:hypothetical protein